MTPSYQVQMKQKQMKNETKTFFYHQKEKKKKDNIKTAIIKTNVWRNKEEEFFTLFI